MNVDEKPLFWIGSARKDLLAMPKAVQREFGFALHLAQIGTRHPGTKGSPPQAGHGTDS